jgi:hypothetical protein
MSNTALKTIFHMFRERVERWVFPHEGDGTDFRDKSNKIK